MYKLILILIIFCSCNKEVIKQERSSSVKDYELALHYGVDDYQHRGGGLVPAMWLDSRIGRISIWMLFKPDNYLSSRADYIEMLYSDDFLNDISEEDLVKKVDSTDNIAIKNNLTQNLLWKEQRYYPWGTDTVQLKTWNYTAPEYHFKIITANFPPFMKIYLHDKHEKSYMQISGNDEAIWYSFSTEGNDTKRFQIVLVSEY